MNEDEVKMRRGELALAMTTMIKRFEEETGHKITALGLAGYIKPSSVEGAVVVVESTPKR